MPGSCNSLLSFIGKLAAATLVLSGSGWCASALEAEQPKEAETRLREALAHHNSPDLHRLLGDCLEAQGDFRQAAEEYRTAATMDPSEPNLFALGTELLKYHGYDQAEQVFKYAADRFPRSARILVGRGIAEYSVAQYDAAVKTFCQAVDLDPSDSRALTFLGKMIGVSPELSDSVQKHLEHFASVYPQNAMAQYFYGLSLLPSQMTAAESRLKKAVVLDASLADAHFQLGVIYQKRHENESAITEFLKTLRYQPSMRAAHYHLAELYTRVGQRDLAKQEYEFVKLHPAKSAADER